MFISSLKVPETSAATADVTSGRTWIHTMSITWASQEPLQTPLISSYSLAFCNKRASWCLLQSIQRWDASSLLELSFLEGIESEVSLWLMKDIHIWIGVTEAWGSGRNQWGSTGPQWLPACHHYVTDLMLPRLLVSGALAQRANSSLCRGRLYSHWKYTWVIPPFFFGGRR